MYMLKDWPSWGGSDWQRVGPPIKGHSMLGKWHWGLRRNRNSAVSQDSGVETRSDSIMSRRRYSVEDALMLGQVGSEEMQSLCNRGHLQSIHIYFMRSVFQWCWLSPGNLCVIADIPRSWCSVWSDVHDGEMCSLQGGVQMGWQTSKPTG